MALLSAQVLRLAYGNDATLETIETLKTEDKVAKAKEMDKTVKVLVEADPLKYGRGMFYISRYKKNSEELAPRLTADNVDKVIVNIQKALELEKESMVS